MSAISIKEEYWDATTRDKFARDQVFVADLRLRETLISDRYSMAKMP